MTNADEIKALKSKRANVRRKLTRFINFVNQEENKNKRDEISVRLQGIYSLLQEFEDYHTQIHVFDETQATEDELNNFEDDYYQIISEAKNVINNSTDSSNGSAVSANVKLPDIQLPTFTGLFTEWISFRDSYKTLIHDSQLNPIQKFHYLKGSLKGEAQQTIAHLSPSTENYESAWSLLVKRYENKRIIVQHHVRALFTLPVINNKDSKSLRSMLQTLHTNLKALENIKRPTDQWDDLLLHMIAAKFDQHTTVAWESTLSSEIPNMESMFQFLTQRCQMWEAFEANHSFKSGSSSFQKLNKIPNNRSSSHLVNSTVNQPICPYCKQSHNIYNCQGFLDLSVEQRYSEIKRRKLCVNCLRGGHKLETCASSNCRKCHKRHNSLLHFENSSSESEPSTSSSKITSSNCAQILNKNITLSTAVINVLGKNGKQVQFRILLDNGSVSNFITERAVKILGLQNLHNINLPLIGIGCTSSTIKQAVKVKISSICNAFEAKLDFLIVPEITGNVPSTEFPPLANLPPNVKLADPMYNVSQPVDLLIGNEIFWDLMCIGQIRLGKQGPILQKTHFGWIVGGAVAARYNQKTASCNVINVSLDNELKKFWEIEEFAEGTPVSGNDLCEEYFPEGLSRNADGRFIVKLPLINDPPNISTSKDRALKLFYNLERRMHKNPQLLKQYSEFMDAYLSLEHMSEIPKPDNSGYFLSHHPVYNESSPTTKLRVVFNASLKTSNSKSINDNLLTGPNLQQDLFSILIRFRTHKIVITADVQKMYRQILLHDDHKKYQQIFWRHNTNEPVKVYQLNTVTYGFASSSFLATRCLIELANQSKFQYPRASDLIYNDFYVDDLITGADTIEQASQLLTEVNFILQSGCFQLHKINSNCPSLVSNLQVNMQSTVSLDKQQPTKTLGVLWHNDTDTITFSTNGKISSQPQVTKRAILSTIAKIFDPLGLVSPITVTAKIILQKIWALKINWDESLPADLHTIWESFVKNFGALDNISIPRRVIHTLEAVQLHGFCDASQNAYGACVYLRTRDSMGIYRAHLLCAKSKVAPLQCLTIPRLELCAALLLARMLDKVTKILNVAIREKFYWTDSSIVLSWISLNPATLKVFVSHRIAEIQSLSADADWHYVPSNKNPADILSRGCTPSRLNQSLLWWHGPEFLQTNTEHINFTAKEHPQLVIPEIKAVCCLSIVNQKPEDPFHLLHRFSSLVKLIRVTAYILRFKHSVTNKKNTIKGSLTCEELQRAHDVVIKSLQSEVFAEDLHNLRHHKQLSKNSKILNLNPFIDEFGLLRVGGRLNNSELLPDQQHQLLLPKNHPVTKLIIKKYHDESAHSGCQATLSALRQKYWPIAARATVRGVIFNCLKCYRVKPIVYQHLMSNLPKSRVTPSRPFSISGVDYAGPFLIKNGYGRTTKTVKVYIVIFVCFSTKAVHIEMVCGCSSLTFLNTLKRFIARRGKPSHLYSDNGTNFVGSNRHLHELKTLFESSEFRSSVIDILSIQNIQWHFIPPHSPHMGGIWEAAVKTAKGHLKRVIGKTLLNFDEMSTLLAMIESCMNSRPLTPLSNDPNDLNALTPGHFLIGAPLIAAPEPNLVDVPCNRLTRYQLVEQLRQHFWQRWSREYLHTLQQRCKWNRLPARQPAPGDLVILKEDNTPPLQWPLARITALHPGQDGQCRVLSVKTVRGVYKRPITKVCAVPCTD
ncbi:uncharacterized protein LOC135129931 [Zophobas morio]|uniref:uncharacterized protein LOC135129931 n=1 Tax=Zophobas morio TaxID=2755281 RepID=UPI003083D066